MRIVLIDNGHGSDTPGKCSPDGSHREYLWAREMAQRLEKSLTAEGIYATRIVTEQRDISIAERCRRANAVCREHGAKNVILISLHNNAAGNLGKWLDARGWTVYVSPNASSRSKRLAQLLYNQAERLGLKGNRSVPKERYWVKNLGICRDTTCPAVLTENLFQDNREDVSILQSEEGRQRIVELHVEAIKNYFNEYNL